VKKDANRRKIFNRRLKSDKDLNEGANGCYENDHDSGDDEIEDFVDTDALFEAMDNTLEFDDTTPLVQDAFQSLPKVDYNKCSRRTMNSTMHMTDKLQTELDNIGDRINNVSKGLEKEDKNDNQKPDSDVMKLQRLLMYLDKYENGKVLARVEVKESTEYYDEDVAFAATLVNGMNNERKQPPYILMDTPPSQEDCIKLFRLCPEQAFAFRIVTQTLLDEKEKKSPPQLRMAILGQAGTGKSESMKAAMWFAYQHNCNKYIGTSAYQWKAALLVKTPQNPAVSCCRFFGTNPLKPNQPPGTIDSCKLCCTADTKIIYIDEGATLGLSFFHTCELAGRNFAKCYHPLTNRCNEFFGGYHFVTTLDFFQHQPVGEKALFKYSNLSKLDLLSMRNKNGDSVVKMSSSNVLGRLAWLQIDTICLFKEQHRFNMSTPGGAKLYKFVQLLWTEMPWTKAEVDWMMDVIESCVLTRDQIIELLKRHPKAIILRNILKPSLTLRLGINHAQLLNERILMWKNHDTCRLTGKAFSEDVHDILQNPNTKYLGKEGVAAKDIMPLDMIYFKGIHYNFIGNTCPDLGFFKNQTCVGVAIVLDPREAPDDVKKPVWQLMYPPLVIFVKPDGTNFGNLIDKQYHIPSGCVPVHQSKQVFNVSSGSKLYNVCAFNCSWLRYKQHSLLYDVIPLSSNS